MTMYINFRGEGCGQDPTNFEAAGTILIIVLKYNVLVATCRQRAEEV